MDIFLGWLVFPIVLSLISVLLGIGIRFLLRNAFEITLVLPVGLAGLILILQLLTTEKFSTVFALPIVMGIVAMCAISLRQEFYKFFQRNRQQSLIALVTYLIYSLPVFASGTPSIAGWIKLDDSATWLAYADRLIEAGRNTFGLQPSSYEAVLQINLNPATGGDPGYPIGAFLPLGAIAKLIGVDPAWAFQPYISFLAATLAVVLFVALRKLIHSLILRSVVSITSTCSALLFGYAMWGGIKEIALALFIALLTYFGVTYSARRGSGYSLMPFALVASSILAISGPSGAIWILFPFGYLVLILSKEKNNAIETGKSLLVLLIGLLFLCLPIFRIKNILDLKSLFNYAKGSPDIGNLLGPLARKEILGIWPSGDFRFPPESNNGPLNLALMIVALLAALGIIYSVKSGYHFVALIAVSSILISLLFSFGNAWVGGKALAISSPFVLLSALIGITWLIETERFIEASLSSIIVVGGVLLSYVLIYHDVWIAPYAQLKELQQIGQDAKLSPPALMLEYSPYGARHFLRNLSAESAGELRRNLIPMNSGQGVTKGASADIDEFPLTSIDPFNTLVLQRSPTASRPPSNYHLLYSKKFYEVWQKDPAANAVLLHKSFGDSSDPGANVNCVDLRALAGRANSTDMLVTAVRDSNITVDFSQNTLPTGWSKGSSLGGVLAPESGQVSMNVSIKKSGYYLLWLAGSFRGRMQIGVDEKQKFGWGNQINHPNSFTQMGKVYLTAGHHIIQLKYSTPVLMPGVGGSPFEFGPLVLSTTDANVPLVKIKPNQIQTLCGQRLDWIEVTR
jgi:hypothetical protein